MPAEPLRPIPVPSVLRSAAASVAVVSALFCLAVGARLALDQARLAERDPLNAPALTELRRQYAEAPDNEELKTRIRQEDARARQTFFACLDRSETGARLLLGGILALLLGLTVMSLFQVTVPDVARFGPVPSDWARRRSARRGLAAGALLLLAAAAGLAAGLAWRDYHDPVQSLTSSAESRAVNLEPGTR